MKKYYYLDGQEKKGPFTEEEFINLNLSYETLIWTEGFDKWRPLKDFPDLLKIIPPPLPENLQTVVNKSRKSKKVGFSFIILLILLIISFMIVYLLIEGKKTKYREELADRIERVFDGKTIICDGVKYGVKGELKKIIKPDKDKKDLDDLNELLENQKANEKQIINIDEYFDDDWLEYEKAKEEGIIEKFYCYEGGFTFKKLKKIDLGFELEVITSTNMAFISTSYLRGTVQEAYNFSYEYLIEENSECYTRGYYDLIENFKYLKNKYYYIENTEKPSSPHSSHWTSSEEATIYNDYHKVYLNTEGWYYEVSERDSKIEEDYFKYFIFTGGISILFFILLIIFNPFKW